MTNHFEIADQNMTVEHYDQWVNYFNSTYPEDVAGLNLRTCNMQRFLDQVAIAKTQPCAFLFLTIHFFAFLCHVLAFFTPSRVRQVPAWHSSCSPKRCYQCLAHRSGPCCSSSCCSSSASPPCSAMSRASCRPSRTSKWCRRGCLTSL